jgi:hypothetical protein
MPTQVMKWKCNLCHTVHETYDAAQQCEYKPSPIRTYLDGDTIVFESEDSGFGRYSYSTDQGIVLYAFLMPEQNAHSWRYVVSARRGFGEYVVGLLADDMHCMSLRSPAEWKVASGYAAELRRLHNQY